LLFIFFSFQLSSNIVYNLFSETLQNFDWWDQFFRTSLWLLLFTIFCYYICTLLLRKQSSLIYRCGQKYTPIGSLSQKFICLITFSNGLCMHDILLNCLLPHNAILESFNDKYDLLHVLFSHISFSKNSETWVISLRSTLGLLSMSWENKSIFDIFGDGQRRNMLFRPLNITVVYIGDLNLKFLWLFID
jgi:hypothetical protein